jgi:hypothetical protein
MMRRNQSKEKICRVVVCDMIASYRSIPLPSRIASVNRVVIT